MEEPLQVWMVFDVVAATEDAAVESLEDHLEKLASEDSVASFSAEIADVEAVENPHPQIDEGFSRVAEVEMDVTSFEDLIGMVINYGPTSVDVQAPNTVTMDIGEVRGGLNAVAQMMHQFLQSGAGGMMISRADDQ